MMMNVQVMKSQFVSSAMAVRTSDICRDEFAETSQKHPCFCFIRSQTIRECSLGVPSVQFDVLSLNTRKAFRLADSLFHVSTKDQAMKSQKMWTFLGFDRQWTPKVHDGNVPAKLTSYILVTLQGYKVWTEKNLDWVASTRSALHIVGLVSAHSSSNAKQRLTKIHKPPTCHQNSRFIFFKQLLPWIFQTEREHSTKIVVCHVCWSWNASPDVCSLWCIPRSSCSISRR